MNDPNRSLAVSWETRATTQADGYPAHQALPPFPPMRLSRAARAGLLGLRLILGLISAMAIFTFLHGSRL
jgi:hypothetical protein